MQGDFHKGVAGSEDVRGVNIPPTFLLDDIQDIEWTGGNILTRWQHVIDKESNWKLQIYYDRFHRRERGGYSQAGVDTVDADFQYQTTLGDSHRVVAGVGYRLEKILFHGSAALDRGFSIGPEEVGVETNRLSTFLQDEIFLIAEKLVLTLGSKFEHNESTGFEYQPTARLLWTPTSRQSVWAAVSRAVRQPSFINNEAQVVVAPFSPTPGLVAFPRILPNRNLDSERVIACELGYRAQVTSSLSLDAALFYNAYDHLIVLGSGALQGGPSPGTLVLPLNTTNGMSGDIYGAELAASWRVTDWWKIHGTYSFLQMHLHADSKLGASGRGAELPELQCPQNQFYLRSSFDLPGHVEIDLIARYVDQLAAFTPGVKSYVGFDVRLAWKPRKDLEFSIVGQNLLDNRHPEIGSNAFVPSPVVEIQRGVYGKVTWEF